MKRMHFARAVAAGGVLLTVLLAASVQTVSATSVGGPGQVRYGVSQQKGFDTCSVPNTSQMQTWWTYSPYWDTVIYMGGDNRGCAQPNLTSAWVTTAHTKVGAFISSGSVRKRLVPGTVADSATTHSTRTTKAS